MVEDFDGGIIFLEGESDMLENQNGCRQEQMNRKVKINIHRLPMQGSKSPSSTCFIANFLNGLKESCHCYHHHYFL